METETKKTESPRRISSLSLTKPRLEGLSDGVFAIVMTLLVIEISIPHETLITISTANELVKELESLRPLFLSYFLSFTVLATFWTSHTFLFHVMIRTIDRFLIFLNLAFLCLIALIPFSANLLGHFPNNPVSVIFYGVNMLVIAILNSAMSNYVENNDHLEHININRRKRTQDRIRRNLTIFCTMLGMTFAFSFVSLSLIFYGLPIIFNVAPRLLELTEKILGLKLEEND